MGRNINIFDLSNEVLLKIFSYVTASELYQLSFICERFQGLVQDHHLWKFVDARSSPNSKEKFNFCHENLHAGTRAALFAGEFRSDQILSDDFLKSIKNFKLLTVLAIENQTISGVANPLSVFPEHLEELSLRNSFVTEFRTFFKYCSAQLTNLRVLLLDCCKWVNSHTLLVISKLPSLEVLSLYMCNQLSDTDIGYISLACIGFQKLRVLDVRYTGYGDDFIRTFSGHLLIAELYFAAYARSYHLDKNRRMLELVKGRTSDEAELNYTDFRLEVDDSSPKDMERAFGTRFRPTQNSMQQVSDRQVDCYWVMESVLEDYVPPKSVLYKRPYGKCTCAEDSQVAPDPRNNEIIEKLETEITRLSNLEAPLTVYYLQPRRGLWMPPPDVLTDWDITTYEHIDHQVLELTRSQFAQSMKVFEVSVFENKNDFLFQTYQFPPKGAETTPRTNEFRLCLRHYTDNKCSDDSYLSTSDCVHCWLEPQPQLAAAPPPYEQGGRRPSTVDSIIAKLRVSPREADPPGPSSSDNAVPGPSSSSASSSSSLEKKNAHLYGLRVYDRDDSEGVPSTINSIIDNLAVLDDVNPCPSDNRDADVPGPSSGSRNAKRGLRLCDDFVNWKKARVQPNEPEDNNEDVPDVRVRLHQAAEGEVRPHLPVPHVQLIRLEHQIPLAPDGVVGPARLQFRRRHYVLEEIFSPPRVKSRTHLRYLSLRGYKDVTDVSLSHLLHLNFDLLDVTGTSVTKEAVLGYKAANANCRVVHESSCRCLPRMHF